MLIHTIAMFCAAVLYYQRSLVGPARIYQFAIRGRTLHVLSFCLLLSSNPTHRGITQLTIFWDRSQTTGRNAFSSLHAEVVPLSSNAPNTDTCIDCNQWLFRPTTTEINRPLTCAAITLEWWFHRVCCERHDSA